MRRLALLAPLLLVAFAAAAAGQEGPVDVPDRLEPADAEQAWRSRSGSRPEPGVEHRVTVGEVVYESFSAREYAWAMLRADVRPSESHNAMLRRGSILWAVQREGGDPQEFCALFETSRYCFRDTDSDERFDRVSILGGGRPSGNLRAPYKLAWRQPLVESGASRHELAYLGAAAGVLRFVFREYKNDLTRPASTHEATYDLAPSGPTLVTFKGAQIEVLEAGNSGIRYRVLVDDAKAFCLASQELLDACRVPEFLAAEFAD